MSRRRSVNGPGVAIVMGATGGLGSAVVQRFAGEGWRLVAVGRDRSRVEAVVARIQSEIADGEVECAPSGSQQARRRRRPGPGSRHCVRAAGRQMAAQREGHIILVASGSGLRPGGRSAAYAAAKAGVIGLMKGAAKDLGPFNVRVNAVNPGLIPHDRMPAVAAGPFLDSYKQETMLGRFSTAEEFARLVAFLATAGHLSGQVINLDSRVFF